MTMHVLYMKQPHSDRWVPALEPNEYINGTLGTVAFNASYSELEEMRVQAANAMDLDSSEQLRWVEVVPANR